MYAMQYDQNSSDSVRSESYPQTEFTADQIDRITKLQSNTIQNNENSISQAQSPYFGGESLTLYASGGEPVTLYANNAGVVSQAVQNPQLLAPSNIIKIGKPTKVVTMLPPPEMTQKLLKQHQQRTLQPKTAQIQARTNYQKPILVNLQTNLLNHQQIFKPSPRIVNVLPNSGQIQTVKVLPPGQKFYPMNSENFQISLKLDQFGKPSVSLTGNQKKFIQNIHQGVLNFMRDIKVPVTAFCKHVLNKHEDDALGIFLTRTNWSIFSTEEKMMYLRLSEWMKEPVTKRMYDLIQKETDLDTKTQMTNQFVETTTVKMSSKKPDNVFTDNEFVAHPMKPREPLGDNIVATESPAIFQSEQLESSEPQEEFSEQYRSIKPAAPVVDGKALFAELEARRVPGPPRSRTTQEERDAIRYWSNLHPNSNSEERGKLAWSLGLTNISVSRLLSYDKRMMLKRGKKDGVEERSWFVDKYKNNDIAGKGLNMSNVPKEPFENYNGLDEKQKSYLYEKAVPRIETANPVTNNVKSQFIQINSEKIKAVIRNAMKSNPAGFDPKKSFKVVIKPDGSSKYNRLALDSYFKNKPQPTEAQIAYFVQCTKVPHNTVKNYLLKREGFGYVEDNSYVDAKNNEFQSKLNLVSERQNPVFRNEIQTQQFYPGNLQQNSQNQFQSKVPAAPPTPLSHQGSLSNLSPDQVAWMENFYQTTPNPDMQTIIDFSKCIDVPFGTVAEFLENMLDAKQKNAALDQETGEGMNNLDDARNIDPEILDLVRKISKKNYSPVLEKELKSLFGDKIFCTLDDIKSYAICNGLNYQVIYRKLNNQESVQLVSEETCKRLVGEHEKAVEYKADDQAYRGLPGTNAYPIKAEPLEYNESIENRADNHNFQEAKGTSYLANNASKSLLGNVPRGNLVENVLKTKQTVEKAYDGLSLSLVPKDPPTIPNIKQEPESPEEAAGIPEINNWLTSTELLFEENYPSNGKVVCKAEPLFETHPRGDIGIELIEIDVETSIEEENCNKRKGSDQPEDLQSKRFKSFNEDLSYDDSGYTTNEDSMVEPTDTLASSDLLSDIIMENIGEVNMLDDSLDLFNDSIKGMDLVNDMFQKVENEDASMNAHVKIKLEVEEPSDEETMMKALNVDGSIEKSKESSVKRCEDPSTFTDLRKVFYGPFVNFNPLFQVVSIKPGFKSDVFEVELSDGKEFSNNFYFKTGSSTLKINLMIKLKQLRYIGARICVESFEPVRLENSILGNPDPIEDEFFSNLRSSKLEARDLFEVSSPKTIMEYILLEENIRSFIESFGCNIELFKFSTGEEDLKKEILFSLCKYEKKLTSKLLKVLSSHLNMVKSEIEQFIETCQAKLTKNMTSVYQDHGYCNLFKVLM